MPHLAFTPNLQRHLDCPAVEVNAGTVREVLEQVFLTNPALRTYILDDQGRLRKHVNVFVDNELIKDRVLLADTVTANSEVFVMQALSGG